MARRTSTREPTSIRWACCCTSCSRAPSRSIRHAGAGADQEIRRIIREVEPPRPSMRLSELGRRLPGSRSCRQSQARRARQTAAQRTGVDPAEGDAQGAGAAVPSPLQLKQDIENYLESRPLIAGPETRRCRLRKFAMRNQRGLAAAAAVFVLLVVGTLFYIHSIRAEQRRTQVALFKAQKQKAEAETQSGIATAVSQFLTNRVLAAPARARLAGRRRCREAIVKAMLDPAAGAVAQDFKDKPLTEAAVARPPPLLLRFHRPGRLGLAPCAGGVGVSPPRPGRRSPRHDGIHL